MADPQLMADFLGWKLTKLTLKNCKLLAEKLFEEFPIVGRESEAEKMVTMQDHFKPVLYRMNLVSQEKDEKIYLGSTATSGWQVNQIAKALKVMPELLSTVQRELSDALSLMNNGIREKDEKQVSRFCQLLQGWSQESKKSFIYDLSKKKRQLEVKSYLPLPTLSLVLDGGEYGEYEVDSRHEFITKILIPYLRLYFVTLFEEGKLRKVFSCATCQRYVVKKSGGLHCSKKCNDDRQNKKPHIKELKRQFEEEGRKEGYK